MPENSTARARALRKILYQPDMLLEDRIRAYKALGEIDPDNFPLTKGNNPISDADIAASISSGTISKASKGFYPDYESPSDIKKKKEKSVKETDKASKESAKAALDKQAREKSDAYRSRQEARLVENTKYQRDEKAKQQAQEQSKNSQKIKETLYDTSFYIKSLDKMDRDVSDEYLLGKIDLAEYNKEKSAIAQRKEYLQGKIDLLNERLGVPKEAAKTQNPITSFRDDKGQMAFTNLIPSGSPSPEGKSMDEAVRLYKGQSAPPPVAEKTMTPYIPYTGEKAAPLTPEQINAQFGVPTVSIPGASAADVNQTPPPAPVSVAPAPPPTPQLEGLPADAKQIGTYQGKRVFQTAAGRRIVEQ